MKHVMTLVLLLAVQTAHASTVTIDFNEVTSQTGDVHITVASKGYTFSTSGMSSVLEAGVSTDGIYLRSVAVGGPGSSGLGDAAISMVRSDGGVFAIHSLDAFGGSSLGMLAGGIEADLSAPVGTGDWLNLESFRYADFGVEFELFELGLDNISVTAVPIPAAAWLLASGLACLGWMRRRIRI